MNGTERNRDQFCTIPMQGIGAIEGSNKRVWCLAQCKVNSMKFLATARCRCYKFMQGQGAIRAVHGREKSVQAIKTPALLQEASKLQMIACWECLLGNYPYTPALILPHPRHRFLHCETQDTRQTSAFTHKSLLNSKTFCNLHSSGS